MVERKQALDILGSSVLAFMKKTGGLKKQELLTEVTNNICLYILLNQRMKASRITDISEMLKVAMNDAQNTPEIVKGFTDVAKEIFFEHYNEKDALITLLDVNEKLGDANTWANLKEYFMEYHNHYIGD